MEGQTKFTPLFQWHKSHKANFSIFGGYEMPLWYKSAKDEHLSVLISAGLFDTSHMAGILVKGKGAKSLIQRCFSRDLDNCLKNNGPLCPGRLVYGVFLSEKGHVIDDSIVYQVGNDLYFVVVNAGMGGTISEHLKENLTDPSTDIIDLTDKIGKMDIQGPNSVKIMFSCVKDPDDVFSKFPYFSFKGFFDPSQDLDLIPKIQLINGKNVLLSRSGYTGEIGFEIYCLKEDTKDIWELIYEKGKNYNISPCGLAARDSLRAGANLPLSHQDIGNWPFINNPWDFCLPWKEYKKEFTKEFIGKASLERLIQENYSTYTYPFIGKDLRKVNLEDHPIVLDDEGKEIGKVLTCCTDMGISLVDDKVISICSKDKPEGFKPRGLCCGFVKIDKQLPYGIWIYLKDSKRKLPACIVKDIRPDRSARKNLKEFI